VGLAGILAEMESLDYQVRVFGIPACAVGAPHRRERYWIVGNANKKRRLPTVPTTGTSCGLLGETFATDEGNKGDVADAESKQNERERSGGFQPVSAQLAHWERFVWLPCADGKLRRVPDNSFGVAHGLHRSVLGALGNSIVPQVAERIIRAMIEAT
jgi:DNA (cytosine-5)-methyltransferase 1